MIDKQFFQELMGEDVRFTHSATNDGGCLGVFYIAKNNNKSLYISTFEDDPEILATIFENKTMVYNGSANSLDELLPQLNENL